MAEQAPAADLLGLTAEIVSAHVSNNPVSLVDLPNLIQEVYRTLATVARRRRSRSRSVRSRQCR